MGSSFIFEIELPPGEILEENSDAESVSNRQVYEVNISLPVEKKKKIYTESDVLSDEAHRLFEELKEAIATQKPKQCHAVIDVLEKQILSKKNTQLVKAVKKRIKKYRFKDALNLLEEK